MQWAHQWHISGTGCQVYHVGMEDSNYSVVIKGMSAVLIMSEHHDVGMLVRAERVLSSTNIIGCIVDTHSFVVVQAVVHDN